MGVKGITVLLRYESKLDGAKCDRSLGSWPKKSLAEIRTERDQVKSTAAKGVAPTADRKAKKLKPKPKLLQRLPRLNAKRLKTKPFMIYLMNGFAMASLAKTVMLN